MEKMSGFSILTECDDILSCISALDEVIAEFDDSISHSSTSSSHTSGASGGPQILKVAASSSPFSRPREPNQSNSELATSPKVKIMESEIKLGNGSGKSKSSVVGIQPNQQPHFLSVNSSPVKPIRQSKGSNPKSASQNPQSYQIQSSTSPSGNHFTSYGIVFSKPRNSSSPRTSPSNNNNNNSPTSHSPPGGTIVGEELMEVDPPGAGSSFPKIKSLKAKEFNQNISKSTSNSPSKLIPVTFVMKPEDLEKFLHGSPAEEDWNCHIEKNLPRSLRKTRKTCFVEDDEEEQEKYCRSPKDFRRNIVISNDPPKRSPILNHKKIDPSGVIPAAQWMRYEDSLLSKESTPSFPPNSSSKNSGSPNVYRMTPTNMVSRNGNDMKPESVGMSTPSPPSTDAGEIDDGYLSMINRHETPSLWPENGIETQTFTPDELKNRALLVSNLNYLNKNAGMNGRVLKTEDQAEYFSDDSLEFEGDTDFPHPCVIKDTAKLEKISSFIHASSPSPIMVQPFINKSCTRKSWSPASEIRIPGKSAINTNTWRKGPPSGLAFDEAQEDSVVRKSVSPVRKPCAFFIPMNSQEKSTLKMTKRSECTGESPLIISKIDFIADEISRKVLEKGIQEAACIHTLLASTTPTHDLNKNFVQPSHNHRAEETGYNDSEPPAKKDAATSVDSSLGLSYEEKLSLSLSSKKQETETKSPTSENDNDTSSDGYEQQYDSLQAADGLERDTLNASLSPQIRVVDEIEDLNEIPPPFIPPPPQVSPASLPIQPHIQPPIRTISSSPSERTSEKSSDSDRDSFPRDLPSRTVAGERPLRTQRQTSRSHENLLDIDRKEYLPHPCVRRGHSATLPSNAVAPLSGRRPSALRQFFGIFKKSKKQPSVLDLPMHSSPRLKEFESPSGGYVGGDSAELPEHFSRYKSRPSVSESQGSQRSSVSKSSNKRSVLSRIFRRKEK